MGPSRRRLDLGRLRAGAITDERPLVLGVAGTTARLLGASPLVVRVALAVLTLAAGWGVALYLVLWWMLRGHDHGAERPGTLRHNLGVIAATAAQLVLVDSWIGGVDPALLWPVGLVGFALALARPVPSANEGRWSVSVGRVVAGAVLMLAGLLSAVGASQDLSSLLDTAVAASVLVGGLGLVFAPWLRRVVTEADADRLRRAQAEARAEMATHLHDSVLQTLTLIQNRSCQPEVAAALAHRQERELRQWLYDHVPEAAAPASSLRSAIDTAAAEIEDQYLKVIECIVVGDTTMTEPVQALVAATREAIVNAAKFAQVARVSVYAEVDRHGELPLTVEVFVRDRGVGFVLDAVPPDRHGIADSICARMERAGGRAEITSRVGSGTEVCLRWPA